MSLDLGAPPEIVTPEPTARHAAPEQGIRDLASEQAQASGPAAPLSSLERLQVRARIAEIEVTRANLALEKDRLQRKLAKPKAAST